MRLEVIREFLTLSEDLNYTKAAKKLHMAQSTLSKHMSDLERELGLSLFNHSVANPALTDVGGLLLQRFSLIDAEICNALDACKELQSRSSRSLRIQLSELSLVQKRSSDCPIRYSLFERREKVPNHNFGRAL